MDACLAASCAAATSGSSASIFLQLIQTLLAAQCGLNSNNFPADRSEEIANSKIDFDFVVVGSGSAGSVVASRLTEVEKWKVVLIEAGENPSILSDIPATHFNMRETPEDYAYRVEPQKHACLGTKTKLCTWTKGKFLGGSSSMNAMVYVRGNDEDYNRWSRLGNKGWSYEEVLPYFKKSVNCDDRLNAEWGSKYCGHGPLTVRYFNFTSTNMNKLFMDAARNINVPVLDSLNNDKYIGYGITQGTVDNGRRMSVAKAFLSPIKDRSNLYVMKSTRADAVLLDGTRAVGVRVTLKDGTSIDVRASKEVILSAGSVASPQILLLSGIGPKQHLNEMGIPSVVDLPVGKNLQDHIAWYGSYSGYRNETTMPPTYMLDQAYEYLMYNRGIFSASGFDLVGFADVNNPASKYPNIQFHHCYIPQGFVNKTHDLLHGLNINDEITQSVLEIVKGADMIINIAVLLNPKSLGELRLRSKNPAEQPRIDANYFSQQEDLQILLTSMKYLKKMLKSETFKQQGVQLRHLDIPGCRHTEPDSDEYWRCNLRHLALSSFHPVGTTKMGSEGDPTAVIDARLKVHGIQGLRVIDASVMPTIISGNTNAPTIMIGEKGADLIKEDWGVTREKDELKEKIIRKDLK